MVGRPHLSLVPAHGLRPRLRAPSARAAGIAASLVAVCGLAYLAARETSLFAVNAVHVTGAPNGVRQQVRAAVKPYVGESLVALDAGELRRRLEALPTVRSLEIDRAFPHTLRIRVTAERPVAILRQDRGSWLVSARGRVIRRVRPAAAGRPAIQPAEEATLEAGDLVEADDVLVALGVLRRVPRPFPVRVTEARVQGGAVALVLDGGAELRLGEPTAVPLKLAVAARVLRAIPAAERSWLAYVDVAVPERPVAAAKSQLSG